MIGWALGTLASTSLLALLVLALREPVARMFGARAAYALWLAPLLRMVLPPLPETAPLPSILIVDNGASAVAGATVPAAGVTWTAALLTVWLLGAAAFLLFHIAAHRRFLDAALRRGRRLASPEAVGPELIESAAVEGPIATGFLRQRILLPAGFADRLSVEEQGLAIEHELLHHRRGDLLALGLSLVVLALHWFNPLAHLAHRIFRRDLEAACDAELAARLGPADRESYARAIVGCAAGKVPQAICTLTTIDDLKRRVTMLTFDHGPVARFTGLACAGLVALGGIALTPQVRAQSAPAEKTHEIKRVEVIRMVGADSKDRDRADLRATLEKCDGGKFEANSEAAPSAGKKEHTRIILCGKPGESKTELATTLENALARIESESDLSAESKARIAAQLRAKIAELRAQ